MKTNTVFFKRNKDTPNEESRKRWFQLVEAWCLSRGLVAPEHSDDWANTADEALLRVWEGGAICAESLARLQLSPAGILDFIQKAAAKGVTVWTFDLGNLTAQLGTFRVMAHMTAELEAKV